LGKKVAIIQSNYIPWKGYFDLIHDVDLFIFYDDVQYTKNDWRNRNKIKTSQGPQWLTIPTGYHNDQLIHEVTLNSGDWALKHWKTLTQYYAKAPFFPQYEAFFKKIYLETKWNFLSELNQHLITQISKEILGIQTSFGRSTDHSLNGNRTDRLVDLLRKSGADSYLSGPTAKDYLQESLFTEAGIRLEYKDYSGYPEYPQFYPPFDHHVTILDLIFQTGDKAPDHIWGWRTKI